MSRKNKSGNHDVGSREPRDPPTTREDGPGKRLATHEDAPGDKRRSVPKVETGDGRTTLTAEKSPHAQASAAPAAEGRRGKRAVPQWDAANQTLWLGKRMRVHFTRQGSYQIKLVEAFQRLGWPNEAIANPLELEAGETEGEKDERLIRTVKNLNQIFASRKINIRFRPLANGKRVKWVYV